MLIAFADYTSLKFNYIFLNRTQGIQENTIKYQL